MTRPFFPFCVASQEAIARAASDPEQAAEVLRLAAAYMRRGEALPANLADYLACAIEASMGKPRGHRSGALLEELNLKTRNRRPAAYWLEVGAFMADLTDSGASINTAATEAAIKFNIGEKTASRYLKTYLAAMSESEAVDRAELVPSSE